MQTTQVQGPATSFDDLFDLRRRYGDAVVEYARFEGRLMREIIEDTGMNSTLHRKTQEIRVGLVMYGGVSLAIYINGVTNEFFRAVRGRGVYKLLKAMTDSDIVVDIVSGTSAGGINGVLLSYALCNNLEFSASATLWRESGDMRRLLRSPEEDGESTNSLLDSEGYYQSSLEKAFREMPPCPAENDVSPFDELDLFVTSTDVDGQIYTVLDDRGYPVDIKDHRAVFVLKHRKGRKEPFKVRDAEGKVLADAEVTYQALATLSRCTSTFPVAFEPTRVANNPPDDGTPDGLLQKWGALGKECTFLDGGVLDNKPFTHTIREIFYRTTDRRVERKLFYIEPDPEEFRKRSAASMPNVVQAALAALVGIPGYESISEDLKLLAEHNSKIAQYNRIAGAFLGRAGDKNQHAPSTLSFIIQSAADTDDSSTDSMNLSSYELLRLIALSERAVDGVLRKDGRNQLLQTPKEKAAARLLFAGFDNPEKLELWPRKGSLILRDYDVYFRIRRAFHVAYHYYDREIAKPTDPAVSREVFDRLNALITTLEIVRTLVEKTLDEIEYPWHDKSPQETWREVDNKLSALLDIDGPSGDRLRAVLGRAYGRPVAPDARFMPESGDAMSQLYTTLDARITKLKESTGGVVLLAPAAGFRSILRETDRYEQEVIRAIAEQYPNNPHVAELSRLHREFPYIDALLFPLQYSSRIFEKDIIDTIRISPKDAQRGLSHRPLKDKVSGDAFYHFGGFFKRSWRSNDILWGRLDGTCKIVETFLTPERIREIARNQNFASDLKRRLTNDLDPAALFPHSTPQAQSDLRLWLLGLLSGEDAAYAGFDAKLSELIEAAQLEILHEDLPKVVEDAILEQADWNQYRVSESVAAQPHGGKVEFDAASFSFKPARNDLDPLVAVAAAGQLVQQFKQNATAYPGGLGQYFRDCYRVGSEDLFRHVPYLVLLEIAATALLVLRNALLHALKPERRRAVLASPIYGWVNFALKLFHGAATFLRRSPNSTLIFMVTLAAVSILALIVGISWYRQIIHPPASGIQATWLIAFIALPAIVLLATACRLIRCGLSFWWKLPLWAAAVALIIWVIEYFGAR